MSKFFFNDFSKKNQKFFFFLLINIAFFGFFLLSGNYYHMPKEGIRDFILIFFHWSLVCFAYFILVYVLALQKVIFIFAFPVLNTISAILIYYIVVFDISINSALIESTINTNIEEAAGLVSIKLIIYSTFILLSSVYVAIYRFRKIKVRYKFVHLVFVLIGTTVCLFVNQIRYKTISHRVPFSVYEASKQYHSISKLMKEDKINISGDAVCQEDTLTVVLVLGEALRADHIGINGYYRSTTPRLEKEGIVSFKNIYSEWTHTNQSVPYILTRADSINKELAYTEQSFISIFKQCGFKTYWLGNQEPGKTYINFIYDCDTNIINKPLHTVYSYNKKLDEELIPYFDKLNSTEEPLKLFILHTIGSHWYYSSHYPKEFEIFTPVLKGKTISNSDQYKIINAYDNTVLYTDFVISELINRLKDQNSILIYLSDHGEVLGEDGKWLHAQNTDWERNPACFLWFSKKNKGKNSELIKTATMNRDKFIRTDFLFHSILHISEIESPYLNYDLSIFNTDSLSSQ